MQTGLGPSLGINLAPSCSKHPSYPLTDATKHHRYSTSKQGRWEHRDGDLEPSPATSPLPVPPSAPQPPGGDLCPPSASWQQGNCSSSPLLLLFSTPSDLSGPAAELCVHTRAPHVLCSSRPHAALTLCGQPPTPLASPASPNN